jgi:hypothetical protein
MISKKPIMRGAFGHIKDPFYFIQTYYLLVSRVADSELLVSLIYKTWPPRIKTWWP